MIVVLILAIIGALFMAFNNGAKDVVNAFSAAVGSKAIKLKHALAIAATLNLAGAILLGGNVSSTLIDGIIRVGTFHDVQSYIVGMISCLIAAGCFVLLSTQTGLPVSSTHAIVGSMTGVALVMGGTHSINWPFLAILTVSWICSPLVAAACSLGTIKLIRMVIFNGETGQILRRTCRWAPVLGCLTLTIVAISVQRGTVLHRFAEAKYLKLYFIFLGLPVAYYLLHIAAKHISKLSEETEHGAERIFRRFQAGTSCLVGFAVGSNDVANSITPVLAIYFVMKNNGIPSNFNQCTIPVWILAIGGLGMSAGVIALGHKVIHTLGHKITLLTSSRGFSVDFATATTIILSSMFGIPVSSTHAATGAVIGVGLERGIKGLNFILLIKIFLIWIVTVPAAAVLTVVIFGILNALVSLVI
ncbi:MAG: inorganic phosphate transporter [Puniceicoccales bacterium]|jgi:PiT family inorganic phosphate transporter|nr:inorganic phosphate transporter [Puniceicoccales bacterium]